MADAGAHLWISQADSDRWAASRVFDTTEPRSYCQVLSKYQQVVEKSIKAIAAGLRDRFIVSIPIGYGHDVARIASALRRRARPNDPTDIQHHINHLLNEHVLNEIKAIDAIAPRRPPAGALHARNTSTHLNSSPASGLCPRFRTCSASRRLEDFGIWPKGSMATPGRSSRP